MLFRSKPTQTKAQLTSLDVAVGQFRAINTPEGQLLRKRFIDALAQNGITGLSDPDLEKRFSEVVKYTASANAFDGNQTIWQSIDYLAGTKQLKGLGAGAGTGPSAKEIKTKRDDVKVIATQLGVELSQEQVNALGYQLADGSIDSTTIKQRIAQLGKINFTMGEAADTIANLKKTAASYGVVYNDDWFNQSASNILKGGIDDSTILADITRQAKERYPTLAKQIDAGYNVQQIASPYIMSMANILELDQNAINLNDQYIQQALTGRNTDNDPVTKPLWQFEQELKQDPRWRYTKNAQQDLMGTARKVLQDFGLAY